MPSPFHYNPVIRAWMWKKTPTEKKCLSETYLDSSILSDDDNLVIKGY